MTTWLFNGTNGADPAAGLIMDSSGNLYGTTEHGGADGDGTVFELAKGSSTITTLASFNGSNGCRSGWRADHGQQRQSLWHDRVWRRRRRRHRFRAGQGKQHHHHPGVVQRQQRDVSSCRADHGQQRQSLWHDRVRRHQRRDGTVFEVAKGSGTITTLASFNGTNGDDPVGGLIMDSSGNLYGTTVGWRSPASDGTIFELAKGSSTITTLASFNGTNGDAPVAGLIMDSSGNLYGTTEYGGVGSLGSRGYGDGTVFELAKGSSTITTLASFNGANGQVPQAGLIMDSSGNLYGTTESGGANGDGTVFEVVQAAASSRPWCRSAAPMEKIQSPG